MKLNAEQLRVIEARRRSAQLDTEASHHRRCGICQSRVTQTNTMGEVGHRYGCPARPSGLGGENGGGNAYYRPAADGGRVRAGKLECPTCHDQTPHVLDEDTVTCERCEHVRQLVADGGRDSCPVCGGPVLRTTSTEPGTEVAQPCGHELGLPARADGGER